MTLIEGEILEKVDIVDEGWWSAVGDGGKKEGLFPCSSISLLVQRSEKKLPIFEEFSELRGID